MKRIVFKNPDGSLAVTTVSPSVDYEAEKAKILANNPHLTFAGDVEETDFPTDIVEDYVVENGAAVKKQVEDSIRHFRASWRFDEINNKIVEDPALVAEERKANVRKVRNELLAETDIEMAVANEKGAANANDMKTYRQSLRDLGTDIDADPENVTFPVKP